jgi:hypothetical protein
MPDDLSPAAPEDVIETLFFALRFNRGKRSHQHDQVMAEGAAAHLLEHLTRSGFVLMRKPPARRHSYPTPESDRGG